MRIRAGQVGDARAAQAIAQAAYALYLPRMDRRPAPMDANFAEAARAGHLHLACDGDAVLGYVICFAKGPDWQIENLAIAPSAQGRGLGAHLVARAETLGRAAGCSRLTLYTNLAMTEAMGLYTHLGFAEVERRREAGFDRVFYSREIAPQGR